MKLSEFKEKVIEIHGREVWEEVEKSYVYKTYTAPEEEQLKEVQGSGYAIQYINNPSEEIKLEALKKDGYAIQYINNPTEKMKLEAIKQNEDVIECIDNPSEEMQLIAVKNNGNNIIEIHNPTDKVIQEAIKKIDINNIYNLKYMLRHIENDLKQEREEQTIKLSELKNMTLEQIKELLNKNIEEESNDII